MFGSDKKPKKSIFGTISPLVEKYGASDIGKGYPDWDAPAFVKVNTAKAIECGPLQYSNPQGDALLKTELKKLYDPAFGRHIDADKEILVTSGAGHGNLCAMRGLLKPNEEIITFEPFFSFYIMQSQSAWVNIKTVPLDENSEYTDSSKRWSLNIDTLRSSVNKKTKAILLNTPHNPTGKVFSLKELQMIATVAKEHNLFIFSDEVYEFMIYDQNYSHIHIATLPGMWSRTLTIFSASKMFSVTGFRVGWVIGPENLIAKCAFISTCDIYSVATPLQRGIGMSILESQENGYIQNLSTTMGRYCNMLVDVLVDVFGISQVFRPQGGYFIVVDISKIPYSLYRRNKEDDHKARDFVFSLWMVEVIKVACYPMCVFYSAANTPSPRVRFCFAKKESTILAASQRLQNLKILISGSKEMKKKKPKL